MRLIDADALKSYIDCGHLRSPIETCFSELDVIRMLDKQPTIDAVPVVRCRECKHYGWEQEPCHGKTQRFCKLHKGLVVMDRDTFCSYGERRCDNDTP